MEEIVVLTKYTIGNAEVGETKTIAQVFSVDCKIGYVFEEMKKRGNWDITIPYCQENHL